MITFLVPVKSARVSGSWNHFSRLFERTLISITNQTSQEFRVVVICHEKPNTDFEHPKLEYIHVDFEPPVLLPEEQDKHDGLKEEDKSKKILAGYEYIQKYQQDYVMVADADDCISNRIAAYVSENKSSNLAGWYFKRGYIYREGDRFLALNKRNFNSLCGTCIIVKPNLLHHIFQRVPHLLYVHQTIDLTSEYSLEPLPFPGSIYSMANSENHFMSNSMIKELNSQKWFSLQMIKSLLRKIRKYRFIPLTNKLKEEYGIYPITK